MALIEGRDYRVKSKDFFYSLERDSDTFYSPGQSEFCFVDTMLEYCGKVFKSVVVDKEYGEQGIRVGGWVFVEWMLEEVNRQQEFEF